MRTSRTPLRACLAALVAAAALLTAGAGTARAVDPPLRDLAAAKGKVIGTAVTGSHGCRAPSPGTGLRRLVERQQSGAHGEPRMRIPRENRLRGLPPTAVRQSGPALLTRPDTTRTATRRGRPGKDLPGNLRAAVDPGVSRSTHG